MERKTVFAGLATVAAMLVTVATVVAAADTLGLSGMLPVTRSEMIIHIGAAQRTNEQNDLFWAEQFRQQLYQNEFALGEWKRKNPGKRPPSVFNQQRSRLEGLIKSLEK